MPIRGETIGTAYIRIKADGSRLDQSLKDEFKKGDKQVEDAGKEHSDLYWEGFKKETRRNRKTTQESIEKAIESGGGVFDAQGKSISTRLMNAIRKGLVDEHNDEIGERIAADIEEGLRRGLIDKSDLPDMLADRRKLVAKALDDIRRDEATAAREFRDDQENEWRIATNNIVTNIRTLSSQAGRQVRVVRDDLRSVAATLHEAEQQLASDEKKLVQVTKELKKELVDQESQLGKNRKAFKSLTRDIKEFTSGVNQGFHDRRTLITQLNTLKTSMDDLGQTDRGMRKLFRNMRRDIILANPTIDRFNNRIDTMSDRVGHLFGRGSRNNFLNWFGSMTRGLVRVTKIFPFVAELATDTFRTFQTGFQDAQEAGGNFFVSTAKGFQTLGVAAMEGIATGGISIVAALGILIITLEAVTFVIGPLISGIVLLIGWFTALASTITFGVVGALAPLVGLLSPIAFGIGIVFLAIKQLDDKTKDMIKGSLEPFKDLMEDLGDIANAEIFDNFAHQMDVLREGLTVDPGSGPGQGGLRKLVEGIGDALGDVIGMFVRVVRHHAFRQFLDVMTVEMPKQLRLLGNIGAKAFEGMLGVLRAVAPFTRRMLEWLSELVTDFSRWVNSPKGQKELTEFFERAEDSVHKLWRFLKAAGKALGVLVDSGKDTGDSIFDTMSKKIEELTAWLESDKGKKALKDWFEDAKEFGDEVGHAIESILDLIDTLDTPENRKAITNFFEGAASIITWLSENWHFIQTLTEWTIKLVGWFLALGPVIYLVVTNMDKIVDAIKWVIHWIVSLYHRFRDGWNAIVQFTENAWDAIEKAIIDPIKRLWDKLFGHSIIPDIKKALNDAWEWIKDKTQKAWNWIHDHIIDPILRVYNWLRDKFLAIKNFISQTWDDIKTSVRNKIDDIVGFFRGLPDRILNLLDDMKNAGKDLIEAFFEGLVNAPTAIGNFAADLASALKDELGGFIQWIIDALNEAIPNSIKVSHGPDIPLPDNPIPDLARGAILTDKRFIIAGEDGPEAIVPLRRPLHLVDPAVRELSAIAQGIATNGTGGGKKIDVGGITVITPTKNPVAVAQETVNAMAATGYF